jgi:hypothetical protein
MLSGGRRVGWQVVALKKAPEKGSNKPIRMYAVAPPFFVPPLGLVSALTHGA